MRVKMVVPTRGSLLSSSANTASRTYCLTSALENASHHRAGGYRYFHYFILYQQRFCPRSRSKYLIAADSAISAMASSL